jgi:hypothetical protein
MDAQNSPHSRIKNLIFYGRLRGFHRFQTMPQAVSARKIRKDNVKIWKALFPAFNQIHAAGGVNVLVAIMIFRRRTAAQTGRVDF